MRVAKQPNGKYYIINGSQKYINQTEDDYYKLVLDEAKKTFHSERFIEGFDLIIKNCSSNDTLREMGFDMPRCELLKYIPKAVIEAHYISGDFATHAKCPVCKTFVRDGMGGKDEVCPTCGQRLEWR